MVRKNLITRVMLGVILFFLINNTIVMSQSGKTKLTFWAYGTMPTYLNAIKADFEAKYPDIELNIQVLGPYEIGEKLLAAMAAGTGVPDVAQMITRRFALFAESGGLVDLTKFAKDSGIYNKLMPEVAASVTYRNKLYGIPIDISPSVIFYRKDIFRQYGLDTDEVWSTWANLVEAAKTLRPKGYYTFNLFVPAGQWGSAFFVQFLMSRGCNIFDDNGKVIRNNKLAADTLQWMYDLKFKYDIANTEVFFTAEHWNTLSSGKVLTYMVGPWGETHIKQFVTTESGKWGVRAFPAWALKGERWTGQWGGITLAIPRLAKNKTAAEKLLSYIFHDDERIFKMVSCIIPTKDAFNKPYLLEKSELTGEAMGKILAQRRVFPFNYFDWAQTEQMLGTAIDALFAERKSPQEVWAKLEQQLIVELGR